MTRRTAIASNVPARRSRRRRPAVAAAAMVAAELLEGRVLFALAGHPGVSQLALQLPGVQVVDGVQLAHLHAR